MTSIAVVMPAYNEADAIGEFLLELHAALEAESLSFIVVDDCSSDGTQQAVEACAGLGVPVVARRMETNRGHGPSTLRALAAGIATGADLVVATDGDGQFHGADVARLVAVAKGGAVDLVEGVRNGRRDPAFRRCVSAATRAMVRMRCGVRVGDANTPLRVYRRPALEELLRAVPASSITPNLLLSAESRRRRMVVIEVPVASRDRRGTSDTGTPWQTTRRHVPSRRFVRFCVAAVREWVSSPTEEPPAGSNVEGRALLGPAGLGAADAVRAGLTP